jgi:hypothetical protein
LPPWPELLAEETRKEQSLQGSCSILARWQGPHWPYASNSFSTTWLICVRFKFGLRTT